MSTIFNLLDNTMIAVVLALFAFSVAVIMISLADEKEAVKWQRNQKEAEPVEDLEVSSYD